jgi:hypothetical protein
LIAKRQPPNRPEYTLDFFSVYSGLFLLFLLQNRQWLQQGGCLLATTIKTKKPLICPLCPGRQTLTEIPINADPRLYVLYPDESLHDRASTIEKCRGHYVGIREFTTKELADKEGEYIASLKTSKSSYLNGIPKIS